MIQRRKVLIGLLLGILSAVCSAFIAIVLASQKQLPTNWVLFVQSLLAFAVSVALSRILGHEQTMAKQLVTTRYRLHVLRAAAGLMIYWFYYQSLKIAPKVDCSLLLNTAPLLVPLLCLLVLRETVRFLDWVGVIAGFSGIVVLLAPELAFKSANPGYLFALLAGFFFALTTVVVRGLNKTESVATTVSFYNLHCVVVLGVAVAVFPHSLSLEEALICLVIGVAFCLKQYAITLSIKYTSATIASVLNLATIPLLAFYGVIAEGAELSGTTLTGTALVVAGSASLAFSARCNSGPGTNASEK